MPRQLAVAAAGVDAGVCGCECGRAGPAVNAQQPEQQQRLRQQGSAAAGRSGVPHQLQLGTLSAGEK